MAEEDSDDSEKTEDPSERRLEDALKKGQVIYSREVTNFLLLLLLTFTVAWLSSPIMRSTAINLESFFGKIHEVNIDEAVLGKLLIKQIGGGFIPLFLPLVLVIVVAVLSSYLQNNAKMVNTTEPLMPDFSRISLMKGIERLFSMRSIIEFIKGLVKLTVVGIVCYLAVIDQLDKLKIIHEYSISNIMTYLLDIIIDMLIAVGIVLAVIAALDYLYQRHEFYKKLKMSKQELKEEYKQTEGSPEIKSKLRSLRMERARKRMMAAIPTADVVITNPIHFSVALKYDQDVMRAPQVVAKGQDLIALKMREIAKEHGVPVVENPPLARALYATVEIDKEVPYEHYKAVAEIISYVYKLKNKKL